MFSVQMVNNQILRYNYQKHLISKFKTGYFYILVIVSCLLFVSVLPSPALAQSPAPSATPNTSTADPNTVSLGVSHSVPINSKNVQDGSIVSTSDQGAILSNIPGDPQVLGVVSTDAAIVLSDNQSGDGYPVVSEGTALVLVSTKSGPIKKGDLIATSTIPGVGVKATQSGYVIGTALQDYTSSDPTKPGKIRVDLSLHYFNSKPTFPGSLSDIFKIALLSTKNGPSAIFKYVVAALVVMGSLVLGFLSFARTAAKGVEALGRNPAASRIIHLGIILNIGVTVLIGLSGLVVAFLIIRL